VRPISVESLYRKAPRWLQSAAVAGVGAYLRWQRFGGEFAALLAEANGATFARPDELCAIRKRLWSERVRPAVKAVAAYGRRSIDLADVSTLPILTKEEVRGRLAEFVRADYPRLRRVWMHTSGSTGAGYSSRSRSIRFAGSMRMSGGTEARTVSRRASGAQSSAAGPSSRRNGARHHTGRSIPPAGPCSTPSTI
jgi:hypothetical protein